MSNTENPIKTYFKYIILGAFLLIIIISFGMPDTISHCGRPSASSIAVVNGERVGYSDFQVYWEFNFSSLKNDKENKIVHLILDRYIQDILFVQKAHSAGFGVTEERVARNIRDLPYLKNEAGKFDPDRLKGLLKHLGIDLTGFTKFLEKSMTQRDYLFFVSMGEVSSKEDIATKNMIDNSALQIEYSFLSLDDMKKRYKNELIVSGEEIDNEINNSDVKISDPTTDRERIKKQIEDKKLDKIKDGIIEKINSAAAADASFAYANSILNGKIGKSAKFKIGEPAKTDDKNSKELFMSKNTREIFTDRCLALQIGKTSPALADNSGIYIFSPLMKVIPSKELAADALNSVLESSNRESAGAIINNVLRTEYENSKIIKNLKTD